MLKKAETKKEMGLILRKKKENWKKEITRTQLKISKQKKRAQKQNSKHQSANKNKKSIAKFYKKQSK